MCVRTFQKKISRKTHFHLKHFKFSAKKITKFKEWLGIGTNIDIKASTAVIEILSNLAYETVNEVFFY